MSEEALERHRKTLTFDLVDKFLREKVKNIACECCGTEDWGIEIIENDKIIQPGIISFTWDGLQINPRHIEFVGLVCLECGHMRIFSGHFIREWREKKFQAEVAQNG